MADRLTRIIEVGPISVLSVCQARVEDAAIWKEWSVSKDSSIKEALLRLAAYEDTGYTPEDFDKLCREMSRIRLEIGVNTYDRLRALVEADRDGRLVVLPCKVGDTVYKANKASRKVNPWVVNAIYFSSKTELIIEAGRGAKHFTLGMFGKTVFLTRAEAEKALGKEQG